MTSIRTPWLKEYCRDWCHTRSYEEYLCVYTINALLGCAGKKRIRVTAYNVKPPGKPRRVYVYRSHPYGVWYWRRRKIDLHSSVDFSLYKKTEELLNKLLKDKADSSGDRISPIAIWLTVETK